MKYVRHYEQKTIKTDTAEEFDILMNSIYEKAAGSGKEPIVHFFDGMGFCATIKYYVSLNLPESLAEEYELKGKGEKCEVCPYLLPNPDKRFKSSICSKFNKRSHYDSPCCDEFYQEFKENKNGEN